MSTTTVPVGGGIHREVHTLHTLASALTLAIAAFAFSAGLVTGTSAATSPLPASGRSVVTSPTQASPTPARTTGASAVTSLCRTGGGSSGPGTSTDRLPSPRPLSSARS